MFLKSNILIQSNIIARFCKLVFGRSWASVGVGFFCFGSANLWGTQCYEEIRKWFVCLIFFFFFFFLFIWAASCLHWRTVYRFSFSWHYYYCLNLVLLVHACYPRNLRAHHRYTKASKISYTAPCNGIVTHGAQIWGLQVLPKQMCPQSLRDVRHFTCVYLQAQTAVDADDICTWRTTVILITGKAGRPSIWAPCQNKNGAASGISLIYVVMLS